ncbi:hypothetical protein [Mesorhizobium loti]|uniref:hypothetical protein n=1 Tax=Rhizobium loti TaxID=381 RepID=UPI0004236B78|nr:hypothetical protein [Mesorhizobium loti]
MTDFTNTTAFISDSTYVDADPATEAVAKAEAEARVAFAPHSARRPAEWQDLTGITTVKDGAVVDIVEEDGAAEAEIAAETETAG